MTDQPTCKTCRYWQNIFMLEDGEVRGAAEPTTDGKCRVRSVIGDWPVRFEDDWCGEHKPLKAEELSPPPDFDVWSEWREPELRGKPLTFEEIDKIKATTPWIKGYKPLKAMTRQAERETRFGTEYRDTLNTGWLS